MTHNVFTMFLYISCFKAKVSTQRKQLKAVPNLLGHWAANFRSGRSVLCTKIKRRNLIQKLIYNVTIWISMIKLYQRNPNSYIINQFLYQISPLYFGA